MPFFLTQYLKSLGDNFGQVTPLIYRSAQPSADRLKELHTKYNITVNLNLRDDFEDEEQEEIRAAGMFPVNVSMSDSRAPTDEQVKAALDVLRTGQIKVVNCVGGRHRTGLVCAVERVADEGWDKQRAWKEAEHYGFYSFPGHGALKDWFFDQFRPEDFRPQP